MNWQKAFIDTFYKVINEENITFSKFNQNRVADHRYKHGVRDLAEVHLQYLLFKGLLNNSYFDRWCVVIWDSYGGRKNTKSRKLHADLWLAKTKYGKVDDSSWIAIEMKKWHPTKAKEDYERLQKMSDTRGLLVYKFGRQSVRLRTKIEESPEFKRLWKKFKKNETGDREVDVVNRDGSHKRYHFEAVLLTW